MTVLNCSYVEPSEDLPLYASSYHCLLGIRTTPEGASEGGKILGRRRCRSARRHRDNRTTRETADAPGRDGADPRRRSCPSENLGVAILLGVAARGEGRVGIGTDWIRFWLPVRTLTGHHAGRNVEDGGFLTGNGVTNSADGGFRLA